MPNAWANRDIWSLKKSVILDQEDPGNEDQVEPSNEARIMAPHALLRLALYMGNRARVSAAPEFYESVKNTARWLNVHPRQVQRLLRGLEALDFIRPTRDLRTINLLHKEKEPGSRTVQHYALAWLINDKLLDDYMQIPREFILRLDDRSLAVVVSILADTHKPVVVRSLHKSTHFVSREVAAECLRTLQDWGDVVVTSQPGAKLTYYAVLNKLPSQIEKTLAKQEATLRRGDTGDLDVDLEAVDRPTTDRLSRRLYAEKYPLDTFWNPSPGSPMARALDLLREAAEVRDLTVGDLTRDEIVLLRSLLCEPGNGFFPPVGQISKRPGRWDRGIKLDESKFRKHLHFFSDTKRIRVMSQGLSVIGCLYLHRADIQEEVRTTLDWEATQQERAARLTPAYAAPASTDAGRFERAYFKHVEWGIDHKPFNPRERRSLAPVLREYPIAPLVDWLSYFGYAFEHSRLDADRVRTFARAIPELDRGVYYKPGQEQRPYGFKPTRVPFLRVMAQPA